ncbi:MAG: hypothetical protein R3A45_09045 [Bdellovibrionota bacterium]
MLIASMLCSTRAYNEKKYATLTFLMISLLWFAGCQQPLTVPNGGTGTGYGSQGCTENCETITKEEIITIVNDAGFVHESEVGNIAMSTILQECTESSMVAQGCWEDGIPNVLAAGADAGFCSDYLTYLQGTASEAGYCETLFTHDPEDVSDPICGDLEKTGHEKSIPSNYYAFEVEVESCFSNGRENSVLFNGPIMTFSSELEGMRPVLTFGTGISAFNVGAGYTQLNHEVGRSPKCDKKKNGLKNRALVKFKPIRDTEVAYGNKMIAVQSLESIYPGDSVLEKTYYSPHTIPLGLHKDITDNLNIAEIHWLFKNIEEPSRGKTKDKKFSYHCYDNNSAPYDTDVVKFQLSRTARTKIKMLMFVKPQ